MCRLFALKAGNPVNLKEYLKGFATISKNSKEFQGHGWGLSYLKDGKLVHYKNIKPIWEDDLSQFPDSTLFIAHARSAFQDEGIQIENNMPFYDDKYSFIFNGELRGVRLKQEGRIGAEKVFNFIKRFPGELLLNLKKATGIITQRSKYVRAMNIIITDGEKFYLHTQFNEDPDYFTLHKHEGDVFAICSVPCFDEHNWTPIENNTTEVVLC